MNNQTHETAAPWPPLRHPRTVRLRRSYLSPSGAGMHNRGAVATFEHDEAQRLLDCAMAVLPSEPLDPPAPDTSPVLVRLLKTWRSVDGRQHFGVGERTQVPRYEAERLMTIDGAVIDNGEPIRTVPDERRARLLARARERMTTILENCK